MPHGKRLTEVENTTDSWRGGCVPVNHVRTGWCINKAKPRSFPGADLGSDHDMVLMTLRLKLKTNHNANSPRLRLDVEKLKYPNIRLQLYSIYSRQK